MTALASDPATPASARGLFGAAADLDTLAATLPLHEPGLAEELARLEVSGQFPVWQHQARRCGFCARPVALRGHIEQLDLASGEVRRTYATEQEPGGYALKPCGNRRAAVCPACAEVYRADTYQLIKAGLVGGKGVPETIRRHPRLFVTFTAPSFGPVHSRDHHGNKRCHLARRPGRCPHGVLLVCGKLHPTDDPRLGEPLCPDCFNYPGAVVWNAMVGRLWRRTREYVYRGLARALRVPVRRIGTLVRLEFVKVAEYQRRGLIHYHALIRLDAADRAPDDTPLPPPPPASVEVLAAAVRWAATTVKVPVPGLADGPVLPVACWGTQLDIRDVTTTEGPGEVSEEAAAGYLAKYATKSTDTFGAALAARVTYSTVATLHRSQLRPHVVRLVRAAWTLGDRPELRALRLQPWAHQFGFGGHMTTKSRRFSTTYTALRAARPAWRRQQRTGTTVPLDAWGRPLDPAQVTTFTAWTVVGIGWATEAERQLALAAAARAREHRRTGRVHA